MASRTIRTVKKSERTKTLSVETGIIFGLALAVGNYDGGSYKTKTINLALPFLIFEYQIKTYK